MKRQVLVTIAMTSAALAASPALAATCDFDPVTGLAVNPPDYMVYSVTFNDFTALVGDAASCLLSIDLTDSGANPIPVGTVIAYAADYRGTLDPTSTASFSVTNEGVETDGTASTTPDDPPINNVYFSNIVGTHGTTLDSDIDLAMLDYDDGANAFSLETIDYTELGRTTMDDIQLSIDGFSAHHTSLVTNLNVMASLLDGSGQRFDQPDGVNVFAGAGSFTVGATGRYALDGGLTLIGGVAGFGQDSGGAGAMGLLFNGLLRYAGPEGGFVRPFGEAGLIAAPLMGVSFSRDYTMQVGALGTPTTNSVRGFGTAGFYGGFVRGGAVIDLDGNSEVVLAASYAKDLLAVGDYSEAITATNPFAASAAAQSGTFDVVKVGGAFTAGIAPQTDLTLSGAIGRTIAQSAWDAGVAFAGSFAGAPVSETFAEYGARVGFEIDPDQHAGAFVHGSTGEVSGTHVEVGGDYHVRF